MVSIGCDVSDSYAGGTQLPWIIRRTLKNEGQFNAQKVCRAHLNFWAPLALPLSLIAPSRSIPTGRRRARQSRRGLQPRTGERSEGVGKPSGFAEVVPSDRTAFAHSAVRGCKPRLLWRAGACQFLIWRS